MTDTAPDFSSLLASVGPAPTPMGLQTNQTVAPRSPSEAAEVLGAAADEEAVVGFAGSGSSLELGGMRPYDLGMISSGMAEVIDWQPEDLTVVVGSGVAVGDLEEQLAERNQTSLLPMGDPRRTIGGVVAEGASDYSRLKYGPTRDRVLEVTFATGYGEVVRGGGRLVKNVTGYDVPRLVTGSMGSLGFVASVCLKLWPVPPVRRIVRVTDPAAILAQLFRPVAVLETDSGNFVYLEGSEGDVNAQAESISGDVVGDTAEPPPVESPVAGSVRVAPRSMATALDTVRASGPDRWVAQHGVGVIEVGWQGIDADTFTGVRKSVEDSGGRLVLRRSGSALADVEPWGAQPGSQAIQRRLKDLFDPAAICNPGKLPGGI